MKGLKNIQVHLELCKVKISLFSAFSSVTGFILSASEIKEQIIILALGIFFLACGSSALNQYHERKIDSLMPRTEKRPIPSGRIHPIHALYFSLILIFLGSSILLLAGSITAPLLGLFAALWYNVIYTYLKRITAFALIPGALIGMIPPAIGWVSGGGLLFDPRLLFLCFFFFLWQVPHFWLLLLNYGDEYRLAGLPSLTGIFNKSQLLRIISAWIFATAVSCLLLAVSGTVHTLLINFFLSGASLWLIWNGLKLLKLRGGELHYSFAFRRMNIYMLLVMLLLSIDKFLA